MLSGPLFYNSASLKEFLTHPGLGLADSNAWSLILYPDINPNLDKSCILINHIL